MESVMAVQCSVTTSAQLLGRASGL